MIVLLLVSCGPGSGPTTPEAPQFKHTVNFCPSEDGTQHVCHLGDYLDDWSALQTFRLHRTKPTQ